MEATQYQSEELKKALEKVNKAAYLNSVDMASLQVAQNILTRLSEGGATVFEKGDYNWKVHVPEKPTVEEFKQAWKNCYGVEFDTCVFNDIKMGYYKNPEDYISLNFSGTKGDGTSCGFLIGLINYIASPRLDNVDDFFWEASINWNTDLDDYRYWMIDKQTGLPQDFIYAKSHETIRKYLIQNIRNNKIIR